MKKIISLILVFVFFISFSVKVSAKILTSKDGTIDIAQNETINDDLLIGSKTANLDGTVNGDVFIGSETANINGIINGNLHIGAGSVILKGQVKGNVYIGSGNVTITESTINGSLLVGGGTISVDDKTIITGSIFIAGGNISIDSEIGRNVYIGAKNIDIKENTKIGMDLYYLFNDQANEVNISDKAIITGNTYKTDYQIPQKQNTQISKKQLAAVKPVLNIFSLISALIIGFLYLKFLRKHITETSAIIFKNFWKSLGIGLLIILTIFPAVMILLVTVVGIPLIGLLFLIISLFIFLSKFIVSLALSNLLSHKFKWNLKDNYWAFALGLIIIYLVKSIPVIGGFASFIITILGLGALTLNLFSKEK